MRAAAVRRLREWPVAGVGAAVQTEAGTPQERPRAWGDAWRRWDLSSPLPVPASALSPMYLYTKFPFLKPQNDLTNTLPGMDPKKSVMYVPKETRTMMFIGKKPSTKG